MAKNTTPVTRVPHPMQPVVLAKDGIVRFKRNAIVEYLVDWCAGYNNHPGYPKIDGPAPDLNEIARLDFSRDDRAQLNQLIGYSVSGCPGLTNAQYDAADKQAQRILRDQKRRQAARKAARKAKR
jgi:hypothetical protein